MRDFLYTIGVIGPENSIKNIKNSVKDINFDFTISTHTYSSLNELIEIYKKNINNWDYILFSGVLLYTFLHHNIKEIKIPNNYLDLEDSYVYGLLINYLLENNYSDLSRLYCDFIGPFNNFIGLKKFVKSNKLPKHNTSLTLNNNNFNEKKLNKIHQNTISEIKKLWNENKIDFVFSRMPKITGTLDELGIPYKTILPPRENIVKTFRNIKKEMEIHKFKNKKDIVAYIDLNINVKNEMNHKNIEFILSNKYLRNDNNRRFEILEYIEENYNYSFNIGVGVASITEDGLFLAFKALTESKNYGNKTSFLVDTDYTTIGPLSKDNCIEYKLPNNILKDYAKKLSISPSKLSRIISLERNGVSKLNSNIIKKYCNITKRSANRILNKLSKNNIIKFIEKKKLTEGKGRPTKVYKINKKHKIYLSLIDYMK